MKRLKKIYLLKFLTNKADKVLIKKLPLIF